MGEARSEHAIQTGSTVVEQRSSRVRRIGTLLTVIGSALGFGSLWRFPEQVAHNGGSAFLLLYGILGTLYAAPLLIMETIAGQLSGGSQFDGSLLAGNKRYVFTGFAVFASLALLSFYSTLLTYTAQYLVMSFEQPWYPYHTDYEYCHELATRALCEPSTGIPIHCPSSNRCICTWSLVNEGCIPNVFHYAKGYFESVTIPNADFRMSSPPSSWTGHVETVNWGLWGIFVANIALALLAVSFGDIVLRWVAYLTMLPSFALVFGLLFYNFSLEGAKDGLNYYVGGFVGADLVDTSIIRSTVAQVMFSCSLGQAIVPALTSMNGRADPIGQPSLIVVIGTVLFALVSGLLVFSMLGHLSLEIGVPIGGPDESGLLGNGGTGLIFVTYSSGISHLTRGSIGSGFLHFFFWLMLYIMGFTTYMTLIKTVVHTLFSGPMVMNFFSKLGIEKPNATYIRTLILFVLLSLFGIINCSDYGVFLVDGIDHFASNLIMPMGTGGLALVYTWIMNEPWYQKNYGKRLRRGQNIFFVCCLWACVVNNFIVSSKSTRGWIWLTFAVITPLLQPFVFAILLSKAKKLPYLVALDLAWNGAFGDTMDQVANLANHEKPVPCQGQRFFRNIAGLIRNMACPTVLCLVVDTMSSPHFLFGYTPAKATMPDWFAAACLFFPMAYFLCVFTTLMYPDWVIGLLCHDGTECTRGLFLKDDYCFGMFSEEESNYNEYTPTGPSSSSSVNRGSFDKSV